MVTSSMLLNAEEKREPIPGPGGAKYMDRGWGPPLGGSELRFSVLRMSARDKPNRDSLKGQSLYEIEPAVLCGNGGASLRSGPG